MTVEGIGRHNHEMKMRKCRIWWPKQLSSTEPLSSNFLLGWSVPSSPDSLDIVVAFACSEVPPPSHAHSGLEVERSNFNIRTVYLRGIHESIFFFQL